MLSFYSWKLQVQRYAISCHQKSYIQCTKSLTLYNRLLMPECVHETSVVFNIQTNQTTGTLL